MHAVDGAPCACDECLPDELRPADDEGHVRLERCNRRDRLGGVDVGRLDQLGAEPRGDLVERALAGAVRVDGARAA